MQLGLDDKVALVTGSWRGTGAGIAEVLAAEGATVLVHGLEPGPADATVAAIERAGGRAVAVHGDIRTDDGAAELRASVEAVVDRVDIVVNNYGAADGTTWEDATGPSWHASYDTNVVSAVRVVDAFVDGMRQRGWGRIVFVATVGATRPGERNPEYYGAKGALPAVTVSLARHLAGTGITVNCVSPGLIATPEVIERFTAQARRRGLDTDWASVERHVLESVMPNHTGRVAFPEDIGRFVAMVVSEPSWHLNGAHLRIDGGAADAVT
ncbi:SDR family NAD(P)-dependent oxidoreductase [Rhabdothermincola salaria]|uniref:SDR family NAD(P)-dependent oxidoreductase n=1 Tax=Rhabdothermincola salaria TaxID=2903142 RepID=UPI001E327D2A|nr:SDR family oxidoreductase [Rhabdothermincola salaria]